MANHFDLVAHEWDNNTIHIKRTEAIAAEMLKIIGSRHYNKALEFGAGTGLLSFALKEHFKGITLMDSSGEMIKVALSKIIEAKVTHINPVFFDLEKNDYTIDTFDIIYSQMVLHHVTDIEDIIAKFYKLLNPGGILAIADLYKEDGTFHDFNFKGHLGFDPDNLVGIMGKTGFHNIKHKPCFLIKKTDNQKKESQYPVFLIVAEKTE